MSYYTDDLYRDVERYCEACRDGDPSARQQLTRLFDKYGHAEVHSACRTYEALRYTANRVFN